MAGADEPHGRRPCRLGALGLGVALVAVAGLTVCGVCLDARRREQVDILSDQVHSLQQLVDVMQKQIVSLQEKINSTIQSKHFGGESRRIKNDPEQEDEVIYEEEEYEYDNDESYEYDDDTPPKAPVKRTPILSDSEQRNSSDIGFIRTSRSLRSGEVTPQVERTNEGSENHRTHEYHSSQHALPSNYQEQRRNRESVVRLRHQGHAINSRNGKSELFSAEEFETTQNPSTVDLLTAHFVGDASRYSKEDAHFYGNSILHHPHGLFKDWKPSSWMIDFGTSNDFPIQNGKLNIQKPGIYFVYAQIYYAATHDRCGFHIKHNGEEVAQCMLMSVSSNRQTKRNTCFTAVVLNLNRFDDIWLSEVEGYRNTSFKSSHSFFGLVRLKAT